MGSEIPPLIEKEKNMAVAVTNTTVAKYNTAYSTAAGFIANAATADTDGLAEVYTITPVKASSQGTLIMRSLGSAADGNIAYSVAVGVNGMAAVTVATGAIVKNTTAVIKLDGRYKSGTGTFVVTFIPEGTDKLKTDHTFSVAFVEAV